MAERKLVVVKSTGFLNELNLHGPILTPTRIPVDRIVKMVSNGKAVYECYPNDPENKEKRVKLTLENIKKNNFVDTPPEKNTVESIKKEEPKLAPVSEEKKDEGVVSTQEVKTEEVSVVEERKDETTEEGNKDTKPNNYNSNKKNNKK